MDLNRDMLIKIFGRERVEDELAELIDEVRKNPEAYRQKVLDVCKNEKA